AARFEDDGGTLFFVGDGWLARGRLLADSGGVGQADAENRQGHSQGRQLPAVHGACPFDEVAGSCPASSRLARRCQSRPPGPAVPAPPAAARSTAGNSPFWIRARRRTITPTVGQRASSCHGSTTR